MGGKSGKHGRRSRKKSKDPSTLQLNKASTRGTELEWIEVEEWRKDLRGTDYSEYYSNRTRPNVESYQRRLPRGTKGFAEAVDSSGNKGWLSKAFSDGRARPDFVSVDRVNKRILVGDVTGSARSTANIRPGGLRQLPNESGQFENRHHLEKTVEDAEQLASHLPDDMKDYEVIAQDRYREQIPNHSKTVKVYKNNRFLRKSAQWRNRTQVRKLPNFSSTTPSITRSGVIESKEPKRSARGVGSRSTEGTARGLTPRTSVQKPPKPQKFTPEIETPNLKKRLIPKKVPIPKGLIIDIILDYTIGKTIETLENELNGVNQDLIRSQWLSDVYSKIKSDVEEAIKWEQDDASTITVLKAYIKLDWEVLLRVQMNDPLVDTIVWAFKFAHGEPGFAKVFEGVNYIQHEVVLYGEDRKSKNKPRLITDKSDRTLEREQHRQFILIWDKNVHLIAQRYRQLAQKSMDQLNRIHSEVLESLKHLTSKEKERITLKFITNQERKIEAALQVYNFKKTRSEARSLIGVIRGQLANRVRPHIVDRATDKVEALLGIISTERNKLSKLTKKQKQNQKDLLSMFLNQRLENL